MLKYFFLMCSGADTNILQNSSKAEQIKYIGIGGTVFFTAIMAFIASSYALYTVFDNYFTAIFFGLIWGLLIFNLDRFIVSTIKKQDNKWKEIWQAAPRIILAIIIAVVISKPLEMKLFEKEINQVLLTQKNELTLANKTQIANQFTPEIEKLTDYIGSQKAYPNAYFLPEYVGEESGTSLDIDIEDRDKLFREAAEVIVTAQQGSASLLQRKLKLGYNRAGRLIDQLYAAKIVGPYQGSTARDVLVETEEELDEILRHLD